MSEWSDWIEHDGKGCPLPLGTLCEIVARGEPGTIEVEMVVRKRTLPAWDWANYGAPMSLSSGGFVPCPCIIRYRYRKPSGLTLLERIAADPQPLPGEPVPA